MKKKKEGIKEDLLPRRGGRGGRRGRRTNPTSFPPIREQINMVMMPNRFPPGRHSFSVMDQTTPNNTTAMDAGHTHTHIQQYKNRLVSKPMYELSVWCHKTNFDQSQSDMQIR